MKPLEELLTALRKPNQTIKVAGWFVMVFLKKKIGLYDHISPTLPFE